MKEKSLKVLFKLLCSRVLLFLEYAESEKTEPSSYNATQRDEIVIEKMQMDLIDSQYGDGFISMSIVYAVFALSNFTAPAIVKLFGHKATMVSCSLFA
jgi:hypothetical protein